MTWHYNSFIKDFGFDGYKMIHHSAFTYNMMYTVQQECLLLFNSINVR
jgi:hypothetical protein